MIYNVHFYNFKKTCFFPRKNLLETRNNSIVKMVGDITAILFKIEEYCHFEASKTSNSENKLYEPIQLKIDKQNHVPS